MTEDSLCLETHRIVAIYCGWSVSHAPRVSFIWGPSQRWVLQLKAFIWDQWWLVAVSSVSWGLISINTHSSVTYDITTAVSRAWYHGWTVTSGHYEAAVMSLVALMTSLCVWLTPVICLSDGQYLLSSVVKWPWYTVSCSKRLLRDSLSICRCDTKCHWQLLCL